MTLRYPLASQGRFHMLGVSLILRWAEPGLAGCGFPLLLLLRPEENSRGNCLPL